MGKSGGEAENILITGGGGFVGSHLIEFILALPEAFRIHALDHSATIHPNLLHLRDEPRLILHQVDLNDRAELTKVLAEVRPSRIFHLAARSFVGPSIINPAATLDNNLHATLNLFEAVREAGLVEQTRLLNIGSGDQYGFIQPDELPVRENTPFRPGNPYAVSKITQEMLGYQYFRSYKLQLVATRAFNHVGPRQSDQLATSTFARQIAQAEARQTAPIIRVGNLEARRDYTDVRDIVRGYWLALDSEGVQPGEVYNLCSGQDYKMLTVLEMLLDMSHASLAIEFDPARARPSDLPVVRGDYSKFHQATGWQPQIPLTQSLQDLLNYWRTRIMNEE